VKQTVPVKFHNVFLFTDFQYFAPNIVLFQINIINSFSFKRFEMKIQF